jgi:hypothetical protein
MASRTIIVTGGDANFFPFLDEALQSLAALNLDKRAALGILDLGLEPGQIRALEARGCSIKKPVWTLRVPSALGTAHHLILIARTALRSYFPGFAIYVWFDADAWAQTPEFFDLMIEGAQANGAAIVRENGSGYRRNFPYNRWWYGHLIASYGLLDGVKTAIRPPTNIGLMALKDTAPHWEAWIRYYEDLISKRGKANLDQHAFNAALELEHLPYACVPARCNWISTLSAPWWNTEQKKLCEPNSSLTPISVLHLAGPNKLRPYHVKRDGRAPVVTALNYKAIQALRDRNLQRT